MLSSLSQRDIQNWESRVSLVPKTSTSRGVLLKGLVTRMTQLAESELLATTGVLVQMMLIFWEHLIIIRVPLSLFKLTIAIKPFWISSHQDRTEHASL